VGRSGREKVLLAVITTVLMLFVLVAMGVALGLSVLVLMLLTTDLGGGT
jgi:hypothetical protein